jgi:hypothetical protein
MGVPLTITGNTVIISPENANNVYESRLVKFEGNRVADDVKVTVNSSGGVLHSFTVEKDEEMILTRSPRDCATTWFTTESEVSATPVDDHEYDESPT